MKKVSRAIVWLNGTLEVLDEHGKPMPKYQGLAKEMIPKLKADFPKCRIEKTPTPEAMSRRFLKDYSAWLESVDRGENEFL